MGSVHLATPSTDGLPAFPLCELCPGQPAVWKQAWLGTWQQEAAWFGSWCCWHAGPSDLSGKQAWKCETNLWPSTRQICSSLRSFSLELLWLARTFFSQVKSQSSAIAARAPRPGKKDFRPPLRTLAVPRALEPPSGKTEPSEAWRKSPVCPKKPRKVLFEPRASEKDLDAEGNWHLPGVFYRSCLYYLLVLLAITSSAFLSAPPRQGGLVCALWITENCSLVLVKLPDNFLPVGKMTNRIWGTLSASTLYYNIVSVTSSYE